MAKQQWNQRLSAEEVADIVGRLRGQGEDLNVVAGYYDISVDVAQHIRDSVTDSTTEAAEQFLASFAGSYKGQVIEAIFNERWDAAAATLMNPLVKLDDVAAGLTAFNARNHTEWNVGNRANFFKDFVRNLDAANTNWPMSVWNRGYTGWQLTGKSRSFEFVPIPQGQATPFLKIEVPPAETAHPVGTLGLPLESQRLGREDESWLMQAAVKLSLIETHFAVRSKRQMLEIVHLQMNIKQSGAEIDSMYRALETIGDDQRRAILVCEAKGRKDDILVSQLLAQAETAFRMPTLQRYEEVTPVAIKVIGTSEVQIVDFAPVQKAQATVLRHLTVSSNARYRLLPPVQGIS